jgi:hypothetical protein
MAAPDEAIVSTKASLAQQPLLLVMPVDMARLDELRATIEGLPQDRLNAALDSVGTVHSTRFVILEDDEGAWAKLIVVAIYDGTAKDYIEAFARQLSLAFNRLFDFVSDAPRTPVEQNVDEFFKYVDAHDVKPVLGRTYLANPGLTVLDIWEAMSRTASTPNIARMNHDHS